MRAVLRDTARGSTRSTLRTFMHTAVEAEAPVSGPTSARIPAARVAHALALRFSRIAKIGVLPSMLQNKRRQSCTKRARALPLPWVMEQPHGPAQNKTATYDRQRPSGWYPFQCLTPLGLLGAAPLLQQNCNAKDHARAHTTPKTRHHISRPDNDACRSAALLCRALRAFVAQPSRPHLTKAYNDPRNEATRAPRVSANIKLPRRRRRRSAGRRRPVLRGRPRLRHRLQEGRVGPRDAGRTTRAEGEI